MGTAWNIESQKSISGSVANDIVTALEQFDATWSRFRDDSIVTKISQSAGTYTLNKTDQLLLQWYKKLYDITRKTVTPLIGQTLSDIGYDASYSLRQKNTVTLTPSWSDIMHLDGPKLVIKSPHLIDVGAAGKGAAVDIVSNILKAGGHSNFVVDASGDIYTSINQTIGLESPFDTTKVIGIVTLKDKSICGSAINRRTWGAGLHHIIDPITSAPTNDVIATWVVADSAMIADGLATALFFTSPQILQKHVHFTYVIIRKNGQILYSKHKDIKIFS